MIRTTKLKIKKYLSHSLPQTGNEELIRMVMNDYLGYEDTDYKGGRSRRRSRTRSRRRHRRKRTYKNRK